MPVVILEVVVDADVAVWPDLAQRLADAIGLTLDSPPGQTWVRIHTLGRDRYAENQSPVDADALPVFVTVLERQSPNGARLQAEVLVLTNAIARVIGRPASCIHIEYAEAAAGRVSFGGRLVQ